MNELMEKLLLIAAGAAVGAVGYMAVKHPEELKGAVNGAVNLGRNMLEKKMNEMAEATPQPKDTREA